VIFKRAREAAKTDSEISELAKKKLKRISIREGSVRYIILNDVPNQKNLPIQRIIVGPQRNQKQRIEEIMTLPGWNGIPIECSKTPFVHTRE